MRENDISVKIYTDISDTDLDSTIQSFKHDHPHCGLSLVQGHLLANNIKIQRRRIRESLRRVDPLGVNFRRQHAIHRRVYRIPGPNSLWHIDGHHSLIRWRMVLHGGIDGFSRMIVFLHCSTNNRSETVFNLFNEAIKRFNVPSRVRSDKGGENIRVCEFMISYRGVAEVTPIDRKLKVLRCKWFCSSHDLGLQTMLTEKNQTSKEKRSAVYKERRHQAELFYFKIAVRLKRRWVQKAVYTKTA